MATTYQDNLGSRRVLEKIGMTFVRAYRLTKEELVGQLPRRRAGALGW